MQKTWDKNQIKTVYGKYNNRQIINLMTNQKINYLTYKRLGNEILGIGEFKGFFNFEYIEEFDVWVLFQYVKDDMGNFRD